MSVLRIPVNRGWCCGELVRTAQACGKAREAEWEVASVVTVHHEAISL